MTIRKDAGSKMKRQFWTPEQDALIMAHPDKGSSWEGWKELLPNRSRHSINIRRYLLGVSPSRDCGTWTNEQRSVLIHGMRQMCAEAGHNPYECMAEMRRLLAQAASKKDKQEG